jgi:cyclopropane-fatty-acyl-phospholipid synthase
LAEGESRMMRVAVVGAGVSGLAAAHELARSGGVRVAVYEKEDCLGGHARTVAVDDDAAGDTVVHLDLGFMVFNRVRTYVRPSS